MMNPNFSSLKKDLLIFKANFHYSFCLSLSKDYPATKHDMSSKYWNINSNYKKTKNVSESKIYPVILEMENYWNKK